MIRDLNQGPSDETIEIIEKKIINEQWSPEQISGWLKRHHNIDISHTWVVTIQQNKLKYCLTLFYSSFQYLRGKSKVFYISTSPTLRFLSSKGTV
jgi:IS30 family transposase